MNLRAFLDRWLFEEYRTDIESLAAYRIMFGAYLLLIALPVGLYLRDEPQAFFNPAVGPAAFFTHFPPFWVILAANGLALLAACTLTIGWHTVASSYAVAIGITLAQTFAYADGKIDQVFIVTLIPLVLAHSGWGHAYSFDARSGRAPMRDVTPDQPWLLATLALLTGFALFTAGAAKISGGWMGVDSLGTRWHLLWNYVVTGRQTPVGGLALHYFPIWLWKCLDWSVAIWEAAFVLTVFRRRWCLAACAFGALFHLGVWLLFDIKVAENVIAYAALVRWSGVRPLVRLAQVTRSLPRAAIDIAAVATFVLSVCTLLIFEWNSVLAFQLRVRDVLIVIGSIFGAWYLLNLRRSEYSRRPQIAGPGSR